MTPAQITRKPAKPKAARKAVAGRAARAGQKTSKLKSAPLAQAEVDNGFYRLRLYVAGQTPKSLIAFANLNRLCEEHLKGKYEIEVIDLLASPQLAKGDQILAIPTLVRKLPLPVRKIIGDLSNTERVLVGLDLRPYSRSSG